MDYKAEAVLGLSNWGGVSIMLDPEEEDFLYYKWYEEEPVRARISNYWDGVKEDWRPYFEIEFTPYYLDEFIRVDY